MPELFRAEALQHLFPDGKAGIENVSLSIDEGESVLVAGKNGAGKSLLMRHFIGLSKPTSGAIYYRGEPIASQIPLIRREVGYVFQDTDAQIFGQTVEEDLAFGPANLGIHGKELEEAVRSALHDAHLEGMSNRRPGTLSGGEKRRLAIAGVLAMRPRCVILDEPFVNLDFPSVQEIIEVLKTLRAEGKTLIVLTHEIEKVFALASRLVILDRGNIVFDALPSRAKKEDFMQSGLLCPYRECYPWQID
ncbi:MAG: ABC transporter ATP-binding protein [Rectinema sp.]|jgi:biotin transport system ATP-binding protein|uniref:Polyamine-transporting ATPase n=1 Tax=uncultured spirochete TaxID=156406 RepID=A0A3P3XRF8_9SPIR|nr:Polyamine-transporting ATPase [uncultured spirochete]